MPQCNIDEARLEGFFNHLSTQVGAEKYSPTYAHKYARNVNALRELQPEDVLPGDIDANLGAPRIPESDIQAFAADFFHVEPSSVPIAHLKKDAVWSLDAAYDAKASVGATSEYGTARANGTWLLELALNMKSPTIYDTIQAGDREKQKLIKERHALSCSAIPTAPSVWSGRTTTPTTICDPACSMVGTSISPA